MRTFVTPTVIVLSLLAAAPRVAAQTAHVASPSAIDAALKAHVDATAADRETILRLLAREEVKEVAGNAGLDLRKAQAAAATLSGQELTEVASQARAVEQALAGGQSRITISTTLLIIALLVLILIVVAVK